MERSNGAFTNPAELWRRWFETVETTSRAWTGAMRGGQEAGGYADPYGIYRQWFGLANAATNGQNGQARAGAVSPGSMPGMGGMPQMDQKSSQENVQRWLAMVGETYRKGAENAVGLLDLGPRWLRMLEEVRENLLNGEAIPTDPLSFGVRWYNATSEPLSRFVSEILENDEFLEGSSRLFENYATLYKVFSKNSEEYLHALQLPTRSDMSRVAGLVVALEDKMDGVEEMLEGAEDDHAELARADSLSNVEGRIGNLEGRIERVEGKLDRLLAAVEALGNAPAASAGQNGDARATAQEEETRGEDAPVRATEAAQRKAEEMGVDLSTVEGSGTNGQITVADVRKKGES